MREGDGRANAQGTGQEIWQESFGNERLSACDESDQQDERNASTLLASARLQRGHPLRRASRRRSPSTVIPERDFEIFNRTMRVPLVKSLGQSANSSGS